MKQPYCDYCGDCCRGLGEAFGIEIRDADSQRMAAFLGLEQTEFLQRYTYVEYTEDDEAVHYLIDQQGACVFLQENRCAVNEAKPMQCYLGWPDRAFLERQPNPRDYPCIPEGKNATELLYVY